jgi:hypothetical protein
VPLVHRPVLDLLLPSYVLKTVWLTFHAAGVKSILESSVPSLYNASGVKVSPSRRNRVMLETKELRGNEKSRNVY